MSGKKTDSMHLALEPIVPAVHFRNPQQQQRIKRQQRRSLPACFGECNGSHQ
jgi:hypothetical protein